VLDLSNKSRISEESKDKASSKGELAPTPAPYQDEIPRIIFKPTQQSSSNNPNPLKIAISSSRSNNQESVGNCHLWSHRLKNGDTDQSQKSARSQAISKKNL
jgi:hypothetical protein